VRELAEALAELAARPGDPGTRQHAVDRAVRAARRLGDLDGHEGECSGAVAALRLAAADLMLFAGAGPRRR
jgi:hypothetical protein